MENQEVSKFCNLHFYENIFSIDNTAPIHHKPVYYRKTIVDWVIVFLTISTNMREVKDYHSS